MSHATYVVKPSGLSDDWNGAAEAIMALDGADILIAPTDAGETFPFPWDTYPTVEGDSIVIEGSAGASGYGYALVRVPRTDADWAFSVEVSCPAENAAEVRSILDAAGIAYAAEGDDA